MERTLSPVFASLLTVWSATAAAQTQVEVPVEPVFGTAAVDTTVQALRAPLPSLSRPASAPSSPDLGLAIATPADVLMPASTVDTLPTVTARVVNSRQVTEAVSCAMVVDVDVSGVASNVRVDCALPQARRSTSIEAMVARTVRGWRFVPGRLGTRAVAVAGVPLQVEIQPARR